MPRVTGPITTTDPSDSYATHDSVYGLGGLREVADHTVRNAIPNNRRREGMLTYTQDDKTFWRLKASPWLGDDTDWQQDIFPESSITSLTSDLAAKAPLASPTLTGTPLAPTATSGTNTTQISTTAFVQNELHSFQPVIAVVVSSNPHADYVTDGTNDEVQFNQAYTDLANGGYTGIKKIFAPDQAYFINNGGGGGLITPQNYIALEGAGMFQTWFYGFGSIAGVFNNGTPSEANRFIGATFSNFAIDGTGMDYSVYETSHKGFSLPYSKQLRFQNLYVYNTPATGYATDWGIDILYDSCIADKCGSRFPGDPGYNGFGIGTGLADAPQEESQMWVNCIARDCGDNGFLLERQFSSAFSNDPRSFQFVNCYATGCKRGFKLTGTSGVTLTNCKAITNVDEGFYGNTLASSSPELDLELIGCEARANGLGGFFFGDDQRFSNIVMSSCHSSGNGTSGTGSGYRLCANRLKLTDCYGWNNAEAGLYVHSLGANSSNAFVDKFMPFGSLTIDGGVFWDNGQAATSINDGIFLSGASWPITSAEITNTHCFDDQATPTQQNGINLQARVSNLTLDGVEAYGHKEAGIKYEANVSDQSAKNIRFMNIRTYNNGRLTSLSATNRAGLRIAFGASGTNVDNIQIINVDSYDDQDAQPPTPPTVAKQTAFQNDTGVLTGDYSYKITFTTVAGETAGGATSVTVTTSSNDIGIVIPLGPVGTTARKIYRTVAGGADGTQKLVTTISDNTSSTYVDNNADGSLGATVPSTDTSGTGWLAPAPDAHLHQTLQPVSGVLTGVYTYKITFVNASGETQGSVTSSSVTTSSNQVLLTNIPIGPPDCTARNIYRTAAGGADGTQKLLATISNNTDVIYVDNIADGSLGATVPTSNTAYAKTQNYGLRLTGSMTNVTVKDSDLRNNLLGPVSNTVSGINFRNVRGYNPYGFYSQGNVSGATTYDFANGNVIESTLTADIAVTIPSGINPSDTLILEFLQDGTGGHTITSWSSNVAISSTFTPTSTASSRSFIMLLWDGTKWADVSRSIASTGGNGITRSVSVVSVDTSLALAANTDYAYFVTASKTMTLPVIASAGTNRYTVKNSSVTSTDIVTVAAQSGEHIEGVSGVTSVTLAQHESIDLIPSSSLGSWQII